MNTATNTTSFGPLAPLMADPDVTQIFIDGPQQVYVERKGKFEDVELQFNDELHLLAVLDKILQPFGMKLDESRPMLDSRLPDGSRMNVVIPPLALNGPTVTIAKFQEDTLTSDDLIRFGSVSTEAMEFIEACVKARLNIVVTGGVGSGKTSILNVLTSLIPDNERIIVIENMAEIQPRQKRVVRLEARPPNIEGKGEVSVRDLLENSLKMRPDRFIIGEVQGGEAFDWAQALSTGHSGSMTSLHATSPRDAFSRLETMVTLNHLSIPVLAVRELLASTIDLIVQQSRLRDGSRKVTHITAVQGMQGDVVLLADIFIFEQSGEENGRITGRLKPTGIRPKFLERLEGPNFILQPAIFGATSEADKIRLLIVDDVVETRENLEKLLYFEDDIAIVGAAANGEEAVKLARTHKPKVILMDTIMPGIDGIAATQTILKELPDTRVIAMVTKGDPETIRQVKEAGAQEILAKPFSSSDLLLAVRKVATLTIGR